ncbi:hypothetical protein ACEPPN_011212 [Leptodophora sp. 'Broadleaf-Isolate-01']
MRCLECGHLVEWCSDEGVAWFLDGLRAEMDECAVEDVTEERAERWDWGFEKMVPLLAGRRREGCWLLKGDGEEEGVGEGDDWKDGEVMGEERGDGDRERDGECEVEQAGSIEGLEALQLVGGEEFTADGFVRFASPLWGSVVDDPLDDGSVRDVSLVGDLMDGNSVVGESEGGNDFEESIAEEDNTTIDEAVDGVEDHSSPETFDVKNPTRENDREPDRFFADGFERSTEGISQCGGLEDIGDGTEDGEGDKGDDNMKVCLGFDSYTESEDSDEEGCTSANAVEIDTDIDSDTQTEQRDARDYYSDAEDTLTDDAMENHVSDEMDIWGDIDQSAESVTSDEEEYDSEASEDSHADDGMDTNGLVDLREEILDDNDEEDFESEDLQMQSDDGKGVQDDVYHDADVEERDEHDFGSEDRRKPHTDNGIEIWEDIYRDPDSEGDDGERDLRCSPDLAASSGMEFDEPEYTGVEREESDGSDEEPEGDQHVQKGYGAQFQGMRVWQGDESEESEEE